MGMTITEKILADHAGKKEVSPGELINARVDIVMGNDITMPISFDIAKEIGATKVFDKDRVILVADHFTPAKDIKSAELSKSLRRYAKEFNITHFFDVGEMGIEHVLLPERGLVVPGDIIIGGDSHTCTYGALGAFSTGVGSTDLAASMITGEIWLRVPETMRFVFTGKLRKWVSGKDLILYTIGQIGVDGARYRAMEFCGETIAGLGMDDRLTMANMAIEAGAKNGIFAPDEITLEYVNSRAKRDYKLYSSDEDASYISVHGFRVDDIEPQVALPHLPENSVPISKVNGVRIDQAVIGSCTNGRISDLAVAAEVLKGRKVHKDVRLIILPGTQEVYREAMRRGYLDIFLQANAAVSTPTCGPCMGGHMGVLASGERAISTTNRNFVGRMGHPASEVYLSNPAVAAASAVKGEICGPDEL